MVTVASWGRLARLPHHVVPLAERRAVGGVIGGRHPGLAYGMGRSYGDVCLNPHGVLWNTRGLDRFIDFDQQAGRITCESGVLLRDIQQLAIPRGWMLPVTPGTQLITVGGAIANDVHGKNHHRLGTFGDHVRRVTLARTTGEVLECGPDRHPEWFAATSGGLGLTGVVTAAEIQLRPVTGPWLDTETIPFGTLEEFMALSAESEADWEHTVAWIDCVASTAGRGLFMRANHSHHTGTPEPAIRRRRFPIDPPVSLVNRASLRPFNAAYYHLGKYRAGRALAHYEPFFYPLDGVLEWNRLYGPKGFFQYQCVIPKGMGLSPVRQMLREIAALGEGSFLAVLKVFGDRQARGLLSFPLPGITLALDFPNRGERTSALFHRLDRIVSESGGRIYPAKDARMPRSLFEAGFPGLEEFMRFRDPGISSALSRRLMGA